MNYKTMQASRIPLFQGVKADDDAYGDAYKQGQAEYNQKKTEKKDEAVENLGKDTSEMDSIDKQIANVEAMIAEIDKKIEDAESNITRAKEDSESMVDYDSTPTESPRGDTVAKSITNERYGDYAGYGR